MGIRRGAGKESRGHRLHVWRLPRRRAAVSDPIETLHHFAAVLDRLQVPYAIMGWRAFREGSAKSLTNERVAMED